MTGETARDIAHDLQALATALMNVRRQVRWTEETGASSERKVEFREVPIPALPTDINVPGRGAEWIFGHGLARSIVAKRLEHAVGDAMSSTLNSYPAVLRRWALNNLDQIRVEWAAATDAVRADIDRRLGYSQQMSVDGAELRKDLERLAVTVER